MLDELNELIKKAKVEEITFANLSQEKTHIDRELAKLATKKDKLNKQLQKEENDVLSLKKTLSIKALFYKMLGNLDEKLTKEEEEFLAAKIAYDNACTDFDLQQQRQTEIAAAIQNVADWQSRFESALRWKESIILENPNQKGYAELISIAEEVAKNEARAKVLKDAYKAGNEANKYIKLVYIYLDKAKGWATADAVGFMNNVSAALKNKWITESRINMHAFKYALQKFEAELGETFIKEEIDLEIGSFLQYMDWFPDSFIADIIVRGRISKALEKNIHIKVKMANVLRKINNAYQETMQTIERLERDKLNLLEMLQ